MRATPSDDDMPHIRGGQGREPDRLWEDAVLSGSAFIALGVLLIIAFLVHCFGGAL